MIFGASSGGNTQEFEARDLMESISFWNATSPKQVRHDSTLSDPYNPGMEWIDLIQWPAMVVTVIAAWLIASQRKFKRNWAFWLFLLSNALWIVWGWHDSAYALIALQVCLAVLNTRGAIKNSSEG